MLSRAFSALGGRRKRGKDLTRAEVERAARTTSRPASSRLGNRRWKKDDEEEGAELGGGGEEGRSGSDCREEGEDRRGEVRVRWREAGGRLRKEREAGRGRRPSEMPASGGFAVRGRSTIGREGGGGKGGTVSWVGGEEGGKKVWTGGWGGWAFWGGAGGEFCLFGSWGGEAVSTEG